MFITLVVDFHKTSVGAALKGHEQQIQRHLEGLIAASTDGGIILSTMMIAARSLGLGVVPVGGIRANALDMIELLGLPEKTFALCGMALGHVRMPAAQNRECPSRHFVMMSATTSPRWSRQLPPTTSI
ncbi:nitroreductase [Pseudomonas cedrina]|uniref:nitroreductase family protein n=1 Tax=Pseudomonas cedrina TaxID=651740 RepID=UPI002788E804|nr:nitroreductase [Pseudomonas cedrina]